MCHRQKSPFWKGIQNQGRRFSPWQSPHASRTARHFPTSVLTRSKAISTSQAMSSSTAEDGLGETILPRFRKVGGNPNRFFSPTGIVRRTETGEIRTAITLAEIPLLREALEKTRPSLMIIDPFQGFIGAKVDFHRANEVRPVMENLKVLAEDFNCAVVLIRHLSKAENVKALYRGMGSIDITAAARSVLLVAPDPREQQAGIPTSESELVTREDAFVLAHSKCNIAPKGPSLAYRISDGGLQFAGTVAISATQLLAGLAGDSGASAAEKFLKENLGDEPKLATLLLAEASRVGISNLQLRAEAKRQELKTKPLVYQGPFYWWRAGAKSVPADAPKEQTSGPEAQKLN